VFIHGGDIGEGSMTRAVWGVGIIELFLIALGRYVKISA